MKKYFLIVFAFFVVFVNAPFVSQAQTAPPVTKAAPRKADLIELTALDPTIKLDIRYATADNFVERAVYAEPRAFLQAPAAKALLRVHHKLKQQNLGITVFDGYRPWSVTKLFWEVTPEDKRKFVADPAEGSRHNRGCAVDLSLYNLQTGKLLEMPSEYDEFSERANPNYSGGTVKQRQNRDLLRQTMEAEGFTVYPEEWWHFDYKDWREYQVYDVSFAAVRDLDAAFTKAEIIERKDFKQYFDSANVTGGILIYNLRKNEFYAYDTIRLDKGFVPASTSKIIHSLIFLETGALKNENETIKWDGVKRSREEWNQDHNLRSAFKTSALWFYVEASRRIKRDEMQHYYNLADYGNQQINDYGTAYWVKGDLRVTMREQIAFLKRLHENRLPFSQRTIEIFKDVFIAEKTDKYVLRAKTGWSDAYAPQVGWYVGYVERGAETFFFATEIGIQTSQDAAQRAEITRNILRSLKVIE